MPHAEALSVDAFIHFLEHAGLWDEAHRLARLPQEDEALSRLRKRIQEAELPPALRMALQQTGHRLGPRLAVRSSAIEEDGEERSFAGQFLSVLDVAPGPALEQAVRDCWASFFGQAAVHYRKRAGGRIRLGMGVVLQEQVASRVSGVVFTMNPVNGSFGELVVEAAWGQGEALVSGQVAPDRYLVHRPRRLPSGLGRLWDRIQVREVKADVVPQPRQLLPIGGRLAWADVPEPERRTLSPEQVVQLARMALRIERLAGQAQDVEFALDPSGRIVLLQARPITTTSAPEPRTAEAEVLWTRRFIGERWPDVASPLGWSISSELLTWFVDYPETHAAYLGGQPPLRLVHGRPYVNVTIFRHLAFKMPGRPPPGFMMDFLPPEEQARWHKRFAYPADWEVYRSIFETTLRERRWQRFRWNPWTNHVAWDRFRDRLDGRLASIDHPLESTAGQLSRVERAIELQREYLGIHVCSLLFANLGWQILRALVPPSDFDAIARAPQDNPTVQVNQALYRLARGELGLAPFLEAYGHRASEASWELFTPRWCEDPSQIEPLLEPYRRGELPDPALRTRARAEETEEALRRLEASLDPADRAWTMHWVHLTRRYLALREEQRFHFDRISWSLKRALLELGERLLERPEDLQWLEWEELRLLAKDQLPDADERIARRTQQWADYAEEPPPPVFLMGDKALPPPVEGDRLQGLGISPGRATGTVRVLRSVDQADRLRPGDVLVAVATDPGWTPLFPVACAVVLELGSMLSHGAVVAREYGLPAVVNVSGATQVLRDGQTVTVDGERGVVWIARPEPADGSLGPDTLPGAPS